MLSNKLIHLIETHEEAISARISHAVRCDPRFTHLARLSDPEARECNREILRNLGHWLQRGNSQQLALQYENLAKARFGLVPLPESIRGLWLIRDKMIEFIDDQAIDLNCLDLYAEEQLERQIGRFFDMLVLHLAEGYETEWRHAAKEAA